jgi:hypothetical protein
MPEISHDHLTAFIDFCERAAEDFSDFELVRDPEQKLRRLLDDQGKVGSFQVIGQHGTASLIAFWRDNKDIDFAHSPIVWLSSEGFPNSVFANSFADFLSILPYGTGFIFDVLCNYYYHKDDPDLQPSPEEKFTPEEISSYLTENEKRYQGHTELINWLNHEVKVGIAKDPLSVIKGAIVSHADLATWLREQC